MAECREPDCTAEVKARSLCMKHYMRLYRTGSVMPATYTCLVDGCFKKVRADNSRGLCAEHRPYWKRLRKELGWEERWVYPTKPWLPVEGSHSGVVHTEAWLKHGGGVTLTALCKPSLLLVSQPVEEPKPCRYCLRVLQEHGLAA